MSGKVSIVVAPPGELLHPKIVKQVLVATEQRDADGDDQP